MQLAGMVRNAIKSVDAEMPQGRLIPLTAVLEGSIEGNRTFTCLLLLLAGIAILLSGTGVYGVMAYALTYRRRELAIRMALGGAAGRVTFDVLKKPLLFASSGLVIGIGGAGLLGWALTDQLYEVAALDPASLGMALLAMVVLIVAATVLPAYRAASADPAVVLRDE
jgi:ABC-type antimicrobial peptide transport system permease subunit